MGTTNTSSNCWYGIRCLKCIRTCVNIGVGNEMLLTFFYIYLTISFILIVLGLFRPEHTELTLVGFTFLFLCSLQILNQNLYYVSGSQTNTTYVYTNSSNTSVASLQANKADQYSQIPLDGVVSHLIGYWLSVIAILGFILTIFGIRRTNYKNV